MPDEQAKAVPQPESAAEVDRIRDIIFGPQMRDYEQRFQIFQRDLDRLRQEIDGLSESLSEHGGDQRKKLQNLRQEMRRADEDLRDELRQTAQKLVAEKVDRIALSDCSSNLGRN